MPKARRRWVVQNLALPFIPWMLGIVAALFALKHPAWQDLGVTIFSITVTLIAFYMGVTISKITNIVEDEFEQGEIPYRSLLWYVVGLFYAVIFAFYDASDLKAEVHQWMWGRVADLGVLCVGVITVMRAHSACKYFKLDTRP